MSLPIAEQPRTEVEIVAIQEVPLAVMRFEGVTIADLKDIYDSAFGAISHVVMSGQVDAAIPAIGVYHGDPMATFDLEVAATLNAPIAEPITVGDATVRPGTLTGGRYGVLSHLGSYEGMGGTWGALMGGVAAQGHTPGFPFVEVYLDDPTTTPVEQLRTDLLVRLAD